MARSLVKKLFLAGAISLSLLSCSVTYKGTFEGFAFEYTNGPSSNKVYFYSKEANGGKITFSDDDKDGRFELINLQGVNLGDPVEEYVNLQTPKMIQSLVEDKKE